MSKAPLLRDTKTRLAKCYMRLCQGTANPEGYISTLPGSSVVFHWPRNDYDQLLCVRLMDTPNCTWSGGFEVNIPKSFHVNMRWATASNHRKQEALAALAGGGGGWSPRPTGP